MEKSGFFGSIGGFVRANRTFFLFVALILVATFGYFWWRSGFTLDVSKFFASSVVNLSSNSTSLPAGGGSVNVAWTLPPVGNSNCALSSSPAVSGWSGATTSSAARSVAITQSTTFRIDCSYTPAVNGSTVRDFATVTVNVAAAGGVTPTPTPQKGGALAPSLTTNPASLPAGGGTMTVTWGAPVTANCTASSTPAVAGWSGALSSGSGTKQVTVTQSATLRLDCSYQPAAGPVQTGFATTPVSVVAGGPTNPPGSGGSSVCPSGALSYGDHGVTVCILRNTFSGVLDAGYPRRCTLPAEWAGKTSLVFEVGMINNGTDPIDSHPAIFHDPVSGCAATAANPGNAASMVSGTQHLNAAGAQGDTTYTFTIPTGAAACGRYQLDDSWIHAANSAIKTFVVGKVIDMGVDCPSITTPPPAPPLVCSPATQTVNVNQSATVTASGGSGTYAWFAPGGTPATAAGTTLAVSYAIPGNKTVTVASGGDQVTCAVVVNSLPPPTTITPPPPTTISPPPPTTITPPPPTCTPAVCNVPPAGCFYQGATQCSCGLLVCPTTPPPTTPPPTTITPPPSSPGLSIQKLVRNVTQNTSFVDSVSAHPSDTVQFSLQVASVGSSDAIAVIVRDVLPTNLTYLPGSTTIDGVPASDGIISTGLNIGNMSPGRTITVAFNAQVAPDAAFPVGGTTLVNMGYARASNAPEVGDQAFVNVLRVVGTPSMSLTKLGRNITRGQVGEFGSINASPGDTLGFVIHVRNTSSVTLTNVIVRDILPSGITLVAGSVRLNTTLPLADTLVTSGVNVGSLAAGQEDIVTLSVRVALAGQLPIGTTTVINTAQTSADGIPPMNAQLPIIIFNPSGSVTEVPTGPGESTLLALIVSSIITLLYVGYTGTDMYQRREVEVLARQAKDDKHLFDFRQ